VVTALAILVAALVGSGAKVRYLSEAHGDQMGAPASARRMPVLVELFTSEGCSSCPPADELLMQLEQKQPVEGAEVIALSEHVDYWNHLGWADPYSSAEYSKRQDAYARALNSDQVYTPQMIVDGRAQFVGSSLSRAREAIENASRDSKAAVDVSLPSEDNGQASVTLAVRVDGPINVREGDSAEVLLAITESGLRSSVSGGENAGRRLGHTAVVRKLMSLGSLNSQGGAQFTARPAIKIDRRWNRDSLKAVVFIQERASRRVLGVASAPLGKSVWRVPGEHQIESGRIK
jgi:hypothetical protein